MKEVRIWAYQSNLSGNANGHFEFLELPVNSKRKDVIKEASKWYCKCFNIKNLGIFKSRIGNVMFCPESTGAYLKPIKKKKNGKAKN